MSSNASFRREAGRGGVSFESVRGQGSDSRANLSLSHQLSVPRLTQTTL